MGSVHWVTFGPERADLCQQVLTYFDKNDILLFTGAGVLHLLAEASPLLACCQQGYFQRGDLPKLAAQIAPPHFQSITNAQLVELTLNAASVITWHP